MVGARLGDAGGHRADADFGNELDRDLTVGIDVLQVVDQLRQILDRIDVVMRRRRNQADAGRRMPHARDHRIDLVAGQLAAFAGLGALRHLDLHHVGVDEIFGGDAEAAGGDLLDRRAHGIAVRHRLEAVALLAAFAGVGLAADPVHGDRQRGMRLARDRPETHRAGGKPPDDILGRLDLVERHRLALLVLGGLDLEQAAQRQQPLRLLVEDPCERPVALQRIAAHGMLQRGNGFRGPGVVLAAGAVGIFAADVERGLVFQRIAERVGMAARGFLGDFGQADTFDPRVGADEILGDELRLQPDRIEDLRAAIGLVGRDAHLRHHLQQALADRLDVALDDLVVVERRRQAVLHRDDGLEGQIRVDRLGAVAGEAGEVMHLARFAGLDHEADRGSQSGADQMMMHGGAGEQRRDRDPVASRGAVAQDDDVDALADGGFGAAAEFVEHLLEAGRAEPGVEGGVERARLEMGVGDLRDRTDLFQVHVGQDRLPHFEPLGAGDALQVEQVRPRPDDRDQAHHQLFADRIDRRVGDLGEILLEIGEQRLRLVRQRRDRRVVAHRAVGFLAGGGHRRHQDGDVFLL